MYSMNYAYSILHKHRLVLLAASVKVILALFYLSLQDTVYCTYCNKDPLIRHTSLAFALVWQGVGT